MLDPVLSRVGQRAICWLGLTLGLVLYAAVLRYPNAESVKLALWGGVTVVVVWLHWASGGTWLDPGRSALRGALRGAVILVAALVAMFVVAELLSLLSPPAPSDYESGLGSMSNPMLLVSVGLKPTVEEVLFRGFLFDIVAPRGSAVAVLVTSVAFSLAHWIGQGDIGYAVAVALPGVALGVLRVVSRGIAVPVAFHVVMNAILF